MESATTQYLVKALNSTQQHLRYKTKLHLFYYSGEGEKYQDVSIYSKNP